MKQASCCMIQNERGEVLLLKRSPTDSSYPNTWCLPGGKLDSGEDFMDACIRETHEETGLWVNVWERYISRETPGMELYFFDAHEYHGDMIAFPSDEHSEFAWVEPKDFHMYDIGEITLTYLNWRFKHELNKS